MHEPAIARALGRRAWRSITVSAAALAFVGVFAALVDAGWPIVEGLAGSGAIGLLLGGAGILAGPRARKEGTP